MTLTVPAQYEGFVRDKVRKGSYSTETEVIGAALDLLKREEQEAGVERARISKAIDAGCKQLQEGKSRSLEEVLARLEERKRRWDANRPGHE